MLTGSFFLVLYHHGHSAAGGHYTLDVLHASREKGGEAWMRIDDEVVRGVGPQEVFGAEEDAGEGEGRCAYLLFYRRVR